MDLTNKMFNKVVVKPDEIEETNNMLYSGLYSQDSINKNTE